MEGAEQECGEREPLQPWHVDSASPNLRKYFSPLSLAPLPEWLASLCGLG